MSKDKLYALTIRSNQDSVMLSPGYQAIMEDSTYKQILAAKILMRAKPHLIPYIDIFEETAELCPGATSTAFRYILGTDQKVARFVMLNCLVRDKAFRRFISHSGFKQTVLETSVECGLSPDLYNDLYLRKVDKVVKKLNALFTDIDVLYLIKYLHSDRGVYAEMIWQ